MLSVLPIKELAGTSIGITFSLCRIDNLTISNHPIHKHGIRLRLFSFYLISSISFVGFLSSSSLVLFLHIDPVYIWLHF